MRLCDRCKDMQKTCCQDTNIVLSLEDVRRITQVYGSNDFYELVHYPDLSYLQAYQFDPNWEKYTFLPGNLTRQVKMDSSGNCAFLRETGCVLSEDIRPLMCRLYPYVYNEFGMIGLVLNDDMICPLQALKAGETAANMLEISWAQANQWREMYYEEWRAEYRARENQQQS